jgi:hypothetical protein
MTPATNDRELTEVELDHVIGGLTCRKAGENPIEYFGTSTTSTGTASARGTGGQIGP